MKYFSFILLVLISACSVNTKLSRTPADDQNPLLFTVEKDSVFANEFLYVYKKNNVRNDSAFTQKDVEDYLDLYINFKLKIHEARNRGMDTTQAYHNEMASYLTQLKKPYLTESHTTDSLIAEAYNRLHTEVRASHILITVPENSNDTLTAYNKIREIRSKAKNGEDFTRLAQEYSQDPSAAVNGGDLGYFTSLMMVYPFENAAYNTAVGEISPVIRTQFGYHILKVTDKRPANGKVKVAHIMLRPAEKDSTEIRNRIFEIYDQAVGGVDWNQLVEQYSEDINSKNTGGELQPFGIGQMPPEFQEAAFALKNPGDISDPVKTKFGWHIIKLKERIPLPPRDELESYIIQRIKNDVRADLGEKAFISRLQKEWSLKRNEASIEYIQSLSKKVLLDSAARDSLVNKMPLFTMSGDTTVYASSFYEYAETNKAKLARVQNIADLYNQFESDILIHQEDAHLTKKYEDYRMLLREYKEGILLFQLMEEEVWSKAGNDSTGLQHYFEENKRAYQVPEQVKVSRYRMDQFPDTSKIGSRPKVFVDQELYDQLHNLEPEEVMTMPVEELGIGTDLSEMHGIIVRREDKLLLVETFTDYTVPDLKNIRGRVIADYQNYLEDNWLKQLQARYRVNRMEKGINYVKDRLVR